MDWPNLPPLSALRAFAAVAEHRSLTGAAAALNVTHPAISAQLRNLETHLSLRLTVREGRGIRLTPAGEDFAAILLGAFADIGHAAQKLAGEMDTQPLQISLTPMFASGFLIQRLAGFYRAHPQIELIVSPEIQIADIGPGGFDIAIRYGTGKWAGLDAQLLIPGCLTVVAARKLIGDRVFSDPAELLDFPLLQELGSVEFSDWLVKCGVPASARRNLIRMPGNLLLDGLRRGEGICATVPFYVADELASGDLVVLFDDPIPNIGYYIVTRPGAHRPALHIFAQWLMATCNSLASDQ
jgi:LysR family glycine cleavage system transcriptional activator